MYAIELPNRNALNIDKNRVGIWLDSIRDYIKWRNVKSKAVHNSVPSFDFIFKLLHQIKNKRIDLQLSIPTAKLISEAHNSCATIGKSQDIDKITKFAFEIKTCVF